MNKRTSKRITAVFAAIAATALVSACGSDDTGATDAAQTSAAASQPVSAETHSSSEDRALTETATATEADSAPAAESAPEAIAPGEPTPGQNPDKPMPGEPQSEQCLDVNSPVVGAAFSSLSPSPGGGGWVAGQSSDAPAGNCPGLEYVLAETPGGTVSSPTQVLFFHDDTYLGTATSDTYAYTMIAASSDNSVSVNYKWLAPEDANCCPSGGPATITYTWDGSQVVMEQALPQEMLDAYGE